MIRRLEEEISDEEKRRIQALTTSTFIQKLCPLKTIDSYRVRRNSKHQLLGKLYIVLFCPKPIQTYE